MFHKSYKTTAPTKVCRPCAWLPNVNSLCINGERYHRQIDPNETDSVGRTSLHHVVLQTIDSESSLIDAIHSGCDVNASDKYGRRPLHYAAEHGHVKCLRCLMNRGALIDVVSRDGLTPLMVAVKRNQPEAVNALVQAGADVNISNDVEDGERAVHYAACSSEIQCIDILVSAEADLNAQDVKGNTALILAVKASDVRMIKALLAAKVDVNRLDGQGRTALHWAAVGNKAECAKLLIRCGAALDIIDKAGDSAYVVTIKTNSIDTLQILIDAQCDRMTIDDNMGTAVTLAAVLGHSSVVETLIHNGDDPDESGYFGMTPLMLAAFESQSETIDTLLAMGADPNAKGRMGGTSMRAVFMKMSFANDVRRHRILAALIRANASINMKMNGRGYFVGCTNGNNSALSFAISSGYISAVRMVLIGGAEVPLQEVLDWIKTTSITSFFDVGPIIDILCDWVSEPRSLRHLCRNAIRSNLRGINPRALIKKLPVPTSLKKYMNFEELDQIEVERAPMLPGASHAMALNEEFTPCGLRIVNGSLSHLIKKPMAPN